MNYVLAAFALVLAFTPPTSTQVMSLYPPADIVWKDGPPSLPAGAKLAVLEGDPSKHFVWTKGETVVQLHGIGPWTITYVNSSDDPRKSK